MDNPVLRPYSALGYRENNYSGVTTNQGMGGLGISYGTGWGPSGNPALSTEIPFQISKAGIEL